ncbi:MAG: DUF1631 domain-containing protein [Xanthomonadales bacterium]|nr:DUF1631 domain-containing protein [Xanthomonadales bacterium]
MNESTRAPAVLPLGRRNQASNERAGDLVDAVRTIAGKHLSQCTSTMFEYVDDALFDLAEKAENNAAQTRYFDGMREVRKLRSMAERKFLAAINQQLGNLSHNTPAPAAANAFESSAPTELSLVANNELEESLAITSMISKNESRLARDLYAVNQRLSVICGGHKIDDASNPIAPAILAQSFSAAMHELNVDVRVRLIVYKLFDRYVLSTLEGLYQAVNAELIRAGVLPQLRPELPHGKGQAAPATAAHQAGPVADLPTVDELGDLPDNLLQTLQALFNARRQVEVGHVVGSIGTATGVRGPSSATPLPSANELLGALSVLQSQLARSGVTPPNAVADDAQTLTREVQQLKAHLLSQVGALRGEQPSRVAAIDEDTIDLVSMLFEFILEDPTLPPEMQVLLGRLQIPYLKAAILDRKLFAHRQHPARRLLDSVAEVAKGWSPAADTDRHLYGKVKSIVEQLIHDFDDDLGIFDRLLLDLQQFQDLNRRRSEVVEQRVAESTRGREKLEMARRLAAREILERIGTLQLPPLVHGILARAWANHLVLTVLRQGESSPEFKAGLRFVDEFILSAQPVQGDEGRRQLRQMLPRIERTLRHGLANVAFQAQDIERLLAQLHLYYRQQLGDAVDAGEVAAGNNEDASILAIPDTIQPVAEHAKAEDPAQAQPAQPAVDSPELRQVEALQPGTWLEFSSEAGMVRAKLSWISPMSGRYLFVNRRGLKVGDYAPQELAPLLAAGRARVLADNALFDRALSAIVGRLSEDTATPLPAPATAGDGSVAAGQQPA